MPYLPNASPVQSTGKVVVHQTAMSSASASDARRRARRENSVFAAFNRHASDCRQCRQPLEVVRCGNKLCDDGHRIAQDVAITLYQMAGKRAEAHHDYKGSYVNMLLDLTDFDGPVYDLVEAMDRGLQAYARSSSSSPPQRQSALYYDPGMPSPASSSRSIQVAEQSTPRKSGSIRINAPIEYGKETHEYEEFTHSNGGRVTTKYYHAEAKPRLIRANSVGDSNRQVKRKGVHFDDEVRCVEYYP